MSGLAFVIDDEAVFRGVASALLGSLGLAVEEADSWGAAASMLDDGLRPDIVFLDHNLGDDLGLELIPEVCRRAPGASVVLATGDHRIDLVVESIRAGAADFLEKPLDEGRVVAVVHSALEKADLRSRLTELESRETERFEGMIGSSPAMRTVFRAIESVGPTEASVLLTGESGTGKELAARAVHRRSARAGGPFVALNMAALPSELVESTLFGHEKGSFTGATERRVGAVEEASGGTLFLDELAEMPIEMQPKLLRFLQDQRFRRIGGQADLEADVRIVSATNRSPGDEVEAGRLRADLYYRLNVVPLHLPPLRERTSDIPLLAEHLLGVLSAKHGKPFDSVEKAAIETLCAHGWPGNVREFSHTLERAMVLNEGPTLTDSMIDLDPPGSSGKGVSPPAGVSIERDGTPNPEPAGEVIPLVELERRAIAHGLKVAGGSAAKAARLLGISEATIYRKIKSYDLRDEPKGS